MNGEVRLDPDSLRSQGARLAELGDRVGQTYVGLRDCLIHAEGSWGDDDLGLAFAEQFKPHAEQLLTNLAAMQESLHGTATGIIDAANQFQAQDASTASRIGTTAQDLDSVGAPAAPMPDTSTATPTFVGTQPAVTPDPAAPPPAAGAPAYPTDPARPSERSTPDRARPPDTSTRQSTPQGDPQRPNPFDRTGRGPDRAGREGRGTSDNPAANSGRRPPSPTVFPPSAPVSPPTATRNAATSVPPPAAGVGRRDTPWTGQGPRTPGSPAGAQPNSPSPRYGSPPRTNKPADEPPRGRDHRGSGGRAGSDPMVRWLARTLAEHHDVQIIGFDSPDLQVPAVRAFVAAVDRVLTDYPVITLDIVAIAELDTESRPVHWRSGPDDPQRPACSITLDQRTAQQPKQATATAETAAEPDIYVATLREFGRALDFAGGGLARRQAQRVLITQYLHRQQGRHHTLAETVSGYRLWRAVVTENPTIQDRFDVSRALGAAFAEVVHRGDEASIQAKTLHAVLVDAASRPR
ncbi:hypothetical protein [Nocardia sp. NPDC052112]|uniref:hypothetical protein n=1 Tax=Nocardia sp. NPDC052112 TaxID=3155646 RepID=UPI0034319065